jgi:tRNA(Arg) A34 adenosine deaminase TadA
MALCKEVTKKDSTEYNHPTGSVIVKDGKVVGTGANQSIFKNKWIQDFHKKYFCIRKIFKIPTGTKYWMCPGCAQFRNHAEPQSIRDAHKKHGPESTRGATMYHWGHWWCCKPCWDAMIAAGIKDVYLVEGATEQFKK